MRYLLLSAVCLLVTVTAARGQFTDPTVKHAPSEPEPVQVEHDPMDEVWDGVGEDKMEEKLPPIETELIDYTHRSVGLQGYLSMPANLPEGEKRPAVLVIHEWWGLNDFAKAQADRLARLGYVAFALDMYGEGKVTTDPEIAKRWSTPLYGNPKMRMRARAGLQQLLEQPHVDRSKIAVVGFCFGGTGALQMAYNGEPIDIAVSFHGNPLPPRSVEVHRIKADIMIAHGGNDPLVKQETIDEFQRMMTRAPAKVRFNVYPDAQHSFMNPEADSFGIDGVGYNKQAAHQAWMDMIALFDDVWEQNPPMQPAEGKIMRSDLVKFNIVVADDWVMAHRRHMRPYEEGEPPLAYDERRTILGHSKRALRVDGELMHLVRNTPGPPTHYNPGLIAYVEYIQGRTLEEFVEDVKEEQSKADPIAWNFNRMTRKITIDGREMLVVPGIARYSDTWATREIFFTMSEGFGVAFIITHHDRETRRFLTRMVRSVDFDEDADMKLDRDAADDRGIRRDAQ